MTSTRSGLNTPPPPQPASDAATSMPTARAAAVVRIRRMIATIATEQRRGAGTGEVHQLLFFDLHRAVTSLYAASDGVAYHVGALMVSLGIPLIGLICLVIGLWDRSRRHRQAHPGYPYPPGPPAPPMGYPGPYPGPPYPAYPPYGYPQQRTAKSATALIIIGAVLLAFGILGNFARVAADMAGRSRPGATDTSMSVGECITQSAYVAQSFGSRPENDCANPANVDQLATKGGPLRPARMGNATAPSTTISATSRPSCVSP